MELLENLDTQHLRKLRSNLASHLPGDPTFTAAAGAVLRALLDREIAHPDRQDRDAADEELRAAQEAELAKRRDSGTGVADDSNEAASDALTSAATPSSGGVDVSNLSDDEVDALLARLQARAAGHQGAGEIDHI